MRDRVEFLVVEEPSACLLSLRGFAVHGLSIAPVPFSPFWRTPTQFSAIDFRQILPGFEIRQLSRLCFCIRQLQLSGLVYSQRSALHLANPALRRLPASPIPSSCLRYLLV